MPKQSSLDSFFGSAKASAAKPKPKPPPATAAAETKMTAEEKENSSNKDKRKREEAVVPSETPASATTESAAAPKRLSPQAVQEEKQQKQGAASKLKKRKVIDDDSSSDEEMAEEKPSEESSSKPKAPPPKAAAAASFFSPKAAVSSKADTSTDLQTKPASVTAVNDKRLTSDILKASKDIRSDAYLLKSLQETCKEAGCTWDDAMPYVVLCDALRRIEETTKRLQIQEILTSLLRQILLKSPRDLYPVLYLASNSVAPAYECVELGIGDSLLIKAIAEASGSSAQHVKAQYEQVGDLGSVAMACKGKQRTLGGFFKSTTPKKALTAADVLTVFREIAQTKGNNAQKWKVEKIKKLLVKTSNVVETKYIIRGLQGKLRIGLAGSTVIISLAHAIALTIPKMVMVTTSKRSEKDGASVPFEVTQYMDRKLSVEKRLEAAANIVKKAYSEIPSYDAILDAALKVPLQDLHKECTLTPGIPVSPMLAKPTKSIHEVLKRLSGLHFTCEYKYDGERAQIHGLESGAYRVFSRNLLDTTEKFPEVPLFVKEANKGNVQSFVLDSEVVAFNNKTGQLVPFQVLSTRKKTEESAETAKVQIIVQAFDLMYLNGTSLLNRTLAERRKLMHEHFEAVPGKFQFATFLDHQENGDTTVIEEFLDAAVKGQCEGLMVKTLDVNAIYEPSRRSLNWLKLKKDYLEGLGDSVDLVPLGAYHGRGKRTGVYGAYLLACYDTDTEEFQSVCKIGTGFSEEDLKTLGEGLKDHIIPQKISQYNVSDQLDCDVWFDAVQVWEVKAADLSKSSAHRGAVGKTGEPGRGIGLRFPRFERLRDDKRPEQATTSDQILDMYYAQDAITGGDNDDDEDDGI